MRRWADGDPRRAARADAPGRRACSSARIRRTAASGEASISPGSATRSIWPRRGRPAGRRRGASRLLRLARTQRLHRRDQHERADRGGDRRQERAHRPRRRTSPARRPARFTSSTCAGRTAGCSASPRDLDEHLGQLERALDAGPGATLEQVAALRRAVLPSARARPAGCAARRRRDRGARPASGRLPSRPHRARAGSSAARPLPGRRHDDGGPSNLVGGAALRRGERAATAVAAAAELSDADRPSGVRPSFDPRRGRAADRRDGRRDRGRRRRCVVGPWLGEVGFEVLYWIPFLHWLFEAPRHRARRPSPSSLAEACAPWYDGLCDRYVEIFDSLTPDEFRRGDAGALGIDRADSRSRSSSGRGTSTSSTLTAGRRLARPGARPPAAPLSTVPERLAGGAAVAATSSTARCTGPWRRPERRRAVRRPPGRVHRRPLLLPRLVSRHARRTGPSSTTSIERVAARRPVVLLNTGVVVDEHDDAEPADHPRVHPTAGRRRTRAEHGRAERRDRPRAASSSAPTEGSRTSHRSTASRRSGSPPIPPRSTRCTSRSRAARPPRTERRSPSSTPSGFELLDAVASARAAGVG